MSGLCFARLERPQAADKPGMVLVGFVGVPGGAWEPLTEPEPGTRQGVNTLEGWNALADRIGGSRCALTT